MINWYSAISHSKTIRTIAVFATGNMVAMLLGVVGSLVQGRYIGPEDMGVFRTFGVAAGYLTFLHLGVFDGLQREIPIQLGRGNKEKAEQAASACLSWILFVSSSCGAIFLGLALRAAYYREWLQFWGWLAYVPFIVATFYGGYLGTTFRTGQQFIRLSKISVIQAVAGTLVLPLLPIMGYFGVCLRTAVTSMTNLLLLHYWQPMKLFPRLDTQSFWAVIRIGLPLSGSGYIATSLWVSLEGTFVLRWFGVKALGLYSMAIIVRAMVAQLVQSLNQVMNVKIYEEYGRSGEIKNCLHLINKPMVIGFLTSLPLIAVGWFILPFAVRLLIPNYVGAISMMRVVLLTVPITFANLPATILWASGRRFDCFASVIAGFMVFTCLSYVFHMWDVGILSILIASIIGQIVNVVVSYIMILRLVLQQKRIANYEGV